MPYSTASDAPSYVPQKHRAQWVHVFNSEWEKHKDKPQAERERIAFSAANSIAGPHTSKKYAKLLLKATEEEARAFADAVIASIEQQFQSVPLEVQPALETAMLSGIGQGSLQLEFSTAGMIASANTIAQNYALERSAELVGMKRDVEGNLVPNPDARWAISNTTRERIREIVSESFAEETPIEEIKTAIQQALEEESEGNGIFSEARAQLIARTEVSNAQAGGNFAVWRDSGLVHKLKWLTSEDESVCPVCEGNDGIEVVLGMPFPSGDLYPGAHPRCRCVLVVSEIAALTP
jgi:SPP1 gp7 family putative phage head morphogenesis protein